MNIQIINLSNDSKLKELSKNLCLPSAFYYKNKEKNLLENILDNFTCKNNKCSIDKGVYEILLKNIKPSDNDTKNHNKKLSRKRSRKYKNVQKSRKKY